MLSESGLQVLHERQHLLLGLLGEVLLHVHLSDGFAEHSVRNRHGPLPAGLGFLDAGELARVELEVRIVEVVADGSAPAAHEMGKHIILQNLQVGLCDIVAQRLEERRLAHNYLLLLRYAAGLEECGEVEARESLENLRGGHRIVEFDVVALLLPGPGIQCEVILDGDCVVGHFGGILHACEFKHLYKECAVAFLDGGVLFLHIIIAVADSQTALAHIENLAVAVHEVGLHEHSEEAAFALQMHLCKMCGEFFLVGNCLYLGDILLQRGRTFFIQAHGVEALLVQVHNLLVHAALLRLHGSHRGEEVVQALYVVLAELVESTETGVFRSEGVVFLPSGDGVFIKIFSRGDLGVEIGEVDCGDLFLLGPAGCEHRD